MLINAIDPEESRIAVVEDGVLQELLVEITNREAYLGNIYKGKVVNIEPSIGAAFVSFGGRVNGFLHVSDVLPAHNRDDFQLSDIVEGRAVVSGDEGPEVLRSVLDDDEVASESEESKSEPESEGETEENSAEEEQVAEAEPVGKEARAVEGAASSEAAAEPQAAAGGENGPARGGRNSSTRRDRDPRGRRPRVPIDQLLKKGQEVVVQITKEGIGAKGPALTTYISLPGRCLVLMPSLPKCGISRRIRDAKERRRLKKIVRELDETGKGGIGFIVRTEGVEKKKLDLERDRDYLKKIWDLVAKRLEVTRAPALLYQESDLVLKAMRDLFSPDIDEVVVDNKDVYLRIVDFAQKLMPHLAERIRLHDVSTPLFSAFGIENEVETLYQSHVELPNGASIVVDQTEALVAIDVNSGRYKPGADLEETAFRTNSDSIPEIVRQLRLRDLGGLIIIDFIDMSLEKHRRSVERRLMAALKGDRARIKVGRISPFGMLEITRQRVGPGLKRTVFMTCPHCKGTGLMRTVQSKALHVLRDLRGILNLKGFSVAQVFLSPQVNDFLVNYKRRSILDLEEAVGKTVVFRAEPSYPVDVVHYRFLTGDGQETRVAIPAGLGVKV